MSKYHVVFSEKAVTLNAGRLADADWSGTPRFLDDDGLEIDGEAWQAILRELGAVPGEFLRARLTRLP